MFNKELKKQLSECQDALKVSEAVVKSIYNHVATIEFTPQGEVIDVNDNFLKIVGYRRNEVIGQSHSAMCKPEYANSSDFVRFWNELGRGKSHSGVFERVAKSGETLWLEATYFPIEVDGKVVKVKKVASDVTDRRSAALSHEAVFDSLDRSQAIIEFEPDGTIITANKNFTDTVKYDLSEIKGRHHRMFCEDAFYNENPNFWRELASGEFKSGQFKRKNKYGEEIWLEATYNPILDSNGKVIKVIKFASDVTANLENENRVREASEVAFETSNETLKTAEKASSLLASSIDLSNDISEKTKEATSKIYQLNEQAESIQSIVSTIKAIADQTNLLALNAAIEAARAGEQGRGFAVVADEVRQLASRTSESTSEIESVVQNNQDLTKSVQGGMDSVSEYVERGKDQINDVAEVMKDITAGATNVCNTVSQLSSK